MDYNTLRESFPNNFFAGWFNFQQAELLGIIHDTHMARRAEVYRQDADVPTSAPLGPGVEFAAADCAAQYYVITIKGCSHSVLGDSSGIRTSYSSVHTGYISRMHR